MEAAAGNQRKGEYFEPGGMLALERSLDSEPGLEEGLTALPQASGSGFSPNGDRVLQQR